MVKNTAEVGCNAVRPDLRGVIGDVRGVNDQVEAAIDRIEALLGVLRGVSPTAPENKNIPDATQSGGMIYELSSAITRGRRLSGALHAAVDELTDVVGQ